MSSYVNSGSVSPRHYAAGSTLDPRLLGLEKVLLEIDYGTDDGDLGFQTQSILTVKSLIDYVVKEAQNMLYEHDILSKIPPYTIQNTLYICEAILFNHYVSNEEPDSQIAQDFEPAPPLLDHWRRMDGPTNKKEVYVKEKKRKNKKKYGHQEKIVIKVEEDVPEEVSPRSPTPQKIWDDYNYETIDLSVPEATDILEEQLRMKYLYELEMKHERERINAQRQEQFEAEQKKLRNFSNSLAENNKRFTYDYEGKLVIMEKLKTKKLPAVNPRVQCDTMLQGVKMNEDFLTQEEKEQKAIVSVTTLKEKPKNKPRVKLDLPFKPALQRFSKERAKETKDPIQDIMRYQETNLAHGYMDKFSMKPGVSLSLGGNYKTVPKSTSVSVLPYTVQSSMQQYLSVQQQNPVKLTKHEYDSLLQHNGNVSRLYQDQNHHMSNEILKDMSLQESSMASLKSRPGRYSQNYSLRKNPTQPILQSHSIVDESIIAEGSVKINDVGKLYELFMKDDDDSSILNIIEQEQTKAEETPQKVDSKETLRQQRVAKKSQFKKEDIKVQPVWGDNPPPSKDTKLPYIPIGQLYRHMEKPQSQASFHDAQSISMISQISQISLKSQGGNQTNRIINARSRVYPEVAEKFNNPHFMAAPKVGKTMGYGVNMKYKIPQAQT